MTNLPNLGGHTDGGHITVGQDIKEVTSNALDDLQDNSQNATDVFVTTAGGTLSLATPQANLDLYLGNGLLRLTGSPAGAFTIDVPDGDRRIAFKNESGQAVTIDTVSGATPTIAIPDGTTKTLHVYGIEIEIVADDATQTGALLADGSVAASGPFDFVDNLLGRVELKDYSETKTAPAPAASAVTLDLENGNGFEVTLDQATTFTFSNPPASGTLGSFTLILKQDGVGGWATTWPASVDWEASSAPTLSNAANLIDILSFMTVDGGTTWFGFTGGINFG